MLEGIFQNRKLCSKPRGVNEITLHFPVLENMFAALGLDYYSDMTSACIRFCKNGNSVRTAQVLGTYVTDVIREDAPASIVVSRSYGDRTSDDIDLDLMLMHPYRFSPELIVSTILHKERSNVSLIIPRCLSQIRHAPRSDTALYKIQAFQAKFVAIAEAGGD